MVIELLEPMNSGRLVTFYGYMCHSNTSWTFQYKFHRKLYALYPTKCPSVWWMVKQIIKGMWSDLTYHFNSSHGQCHYSRLCDTSTPTFALSGCMLRQSSTHWFERCHRRIPKANPKRWEDEEEQEPEEPTFRETVLWIKLPICFRGSRKVISSG